MLILKSELRHILKTVLEEHFPEGILESVGEATEDILNKCQDNFDIRDDETEIDDSDECE